MIAALLALWLPAVALAQNEEPTGAIELGGAYSPGRAPGFVLGVHMGVPVELTRRHAMWQVYPELSFRYTNLFASDSLQALGNVSVGAGGRLSAVVWKDSPRKKKRFKGREKYRQLVDIGAFAHGGVGFDTTRNPLDPDSLFDPRPYGDIGVFGAYHDPQYAIGVQFTQGILLPAGWELERTPITSVGVYVELPLEKIIEML